MPKRSLHIPSPSLSRRFIFAAVSLVILLLGLNGLVAVGEYLAYGAVSIDGKPLGLYMRKAGRNQLQPGARLDGWLYRIHIGPMGFREPNPQLDRTDPVTRVWCFGGSTTFDIYARNDDEAWPALMGQELQGRFGATEVVNAGIPGELLINNLVDLEAWSPTVRPRYVVFYQGPNELRSVLTIPGPPKSSYVPALFAGWPLPRFLERIIPQRAPPGLMGSPRRLSEPQRGELRRRIDEAVNLILRFGARPVLATHALRAAPGETGEAARRSVAETAGMLDLSPEGAIDAFAQYNDILVEFSRNRGLPLADVRAAVGPEPENWGDSTHFREPGSRRAAAVVAAAIEADMASRPGEPPRGPPGGLIQDDPGPRR